MPETSKVSIRRIEAALDTLGDLTTEEHEELDGSTRDEIGSVRYALEQIVERRRSRGR